MDSFIQKARNLLNECQELQPHDLDLISLNRLFSEYTNFRNNFLADNKFIDNMILHDLEIIQKCISNARKTDEELSAKFLANRFNQFNNARQDIIDDLKKIVEIIS